MSDERDSGHEQAEAFLKKYKVNPDTPGLDRRMEATAAGGGNRGLVVLLALAAAAALIVVAVMQASNRTPATAEGTIAAPALPDDLPVLRAMAVFPEPEATWVVMADVSTGESRVLAAGETWAGVRVERVGPEGVSFVDAGGVRRDMRPGQFEASYAAYAVGTVAFVRDRLQNGRGLLADIDLLARMAELGSKDAVALLETASLHMDTSLAQSARKALTGDPAQGPEQVRSLIEWATTGNPAFRARSVETLAAQSGLLARTFFRDALRRRDDPLLPSYVQGAVRQGDALCIPALMELERDESVDERARAAVREALIALTPPAASK